MGDPHHRSPQVFPPTLLVEMRGGVTPERANVKAPPVAGERDRGRARRLVQVVRRPATRRRFATLARPATLAPS